MELISQDITGGIQEILGSSYHIVPELMLVIAAIALLLVELISKNANWKIKTGISLVFVFLTLATISFSSDSNQLFGGALVSDGLSHMFEAIFLLTLLVCFVFPKGKKEIRKLGEYHFLLFSLVLGAFLVIKAQNLLIFYLSLELISISSYILTNLGMRKQGYEAGIKYLLFGALASGVMLYGMSLLYGLQGSLDIQVVLGSATGTSLEMVAIFLFSAGVLFKLSMVPMHIWTPDVYEATPISVVAVFSVIPKLAALAFIFRSISFITSETVLLNFTQVVSWLAIISMFVGNLGAIWQKNAKRMMAYSSIAHAGFLIIAVVLHDQFGLQAILFYSAVYALMNLGTFYFIALMEGNGLNEISDYKGVGKKSILISVSLVVLMISLTGLPPTGGFTAKLLLFSAVWAKYEVTQYSFLLWLFVLGLVNTVIALFFYLKIPYVSIFKKHEESDSLKITLKDGMIFSLISLLILVLFFKPDLLFDFTNKINFVFSSQP